MSAPSTDPSPDSLADEPLPPVTELPRSPASDRMMRLFEPVLQSLDQSVQGAAASQVHLRQELDHALLSVKQLKELTDDDVMTTVLEEKSKKLLNLKRRLTLVHTILQTCNERTKKMCSSKT